MKKRLVICFGKSNLCWQLGFRVFMWVLAMLVIDMRTAFAQQPTCNTFSYESDIITSDKTYSVRKKELENAYLEKSKNGQLKSMNTGLLTIPVAIHIVHAPGETTGTGSNLSDQQLADAMQFLNGVFQGTAIDPVGSNAGPIDIAFCLADITRNSSSNFNDLDRATEDNPAFQAQSIKTAFGTANQYPRTDFMNVWVVGNICQNAPNECSLVGYSTLATAHGSWYDGIVIEASSLNGFGMAHEVGHYLNLKHTFGPFDNFADCTNNDCLTDNDCVCDTRPDGTLFLCETTNQCQTDLDSGPFTMDENDPNGNIMDYGDCYQYFTVGQRDRMRDAIEGARSSLMSNMGACCVPDMHATFTYNYFNNDQEINLDGIGSNLNGNVTNYTWLIDGHCVNLIISSKV
ncbi:MAG: M43 family zinc metalloprotease [Saprospiraceae bacterium]|nr:M43 family zinc metalloprotease [Saprospiraceae bacterium]